MSPPYRGLPKPPPHLRSQHPQRQPSERQVSGTTNEKWPRLPIKSLTAGSPKRRSTNARNSFVAESRATIVSTQSPKQFVLKNGGFSKIGVFKVFTLDGAGQTLFINCDSFRFEMFENRIPKTKIVFVSECLETRFQSPMVFV